jgi:hypothetical protein
MGTPARFTTGLGTQSSSKTLGDFPLPDPHQTAGNSGYGIAMYESDYYDLGSSASRTITGTSSTFTTTDGVGGVAILTPGAATTASAVYRTSAGFQFISGQKFWYRARGAISAVAAPTAYAGMIKTGASATDSLLFKMAAGGVVSLVSTIASTATTLVANVATLTAGTFASFGFYYNGTDLLVFANDVLVARVAGITIGATSSSTLTNALLTPIAQITPTASDTFSLDHLLAAQEVVR